MGLPESWYETSFDNDPKAPPLSEQEIETLKAKMFEEGRLYGIEEARQEINAEIKLCLGQLNNGLEDISIQVSRIQEKLPQDTLLLADSLIQVLWPHWAAGGAQAEIQYLVSKTCEELQPRLNIEVLVTEDLQKSLKDTLQDLPVTIKIDENLSKGDCQIRWEGGGLERRETWLKQKLNEIIEQYRVQIETLGNRE